MGNIDWNLGELLGYIIAIFIFIALWVGCELFTNWMEKQIDKHLGKYPFWEDAWSHNLNR